MANKLHAVTGLRKLKLTAKVIRAQTICDAMQASPHFAAATLPLSFATVQQAIDKLSAAVQAARSVNGSVAATSHMYDEDRLLMGIFGMLRSYVEYIANQSQEPETVILSAGMRVSVPNGPGGVSALHLEAIGGGKIRVRVPRSEDEKAFVFETSFDRENWNRARSSTLSKIELGGFEPGTIVHVRYYGIGKNGDGPMREGKWVLVI